MENDRSQRGLRAFLMLWLGLAYLWGLPGIARLITPNCAAPTLPCVFAPNLALLDLPGIALFSALMALLGGSILLGLSGRLNRAILQIWFSAQAALVFAIYLSDRQETIALSLALALVLESMVVRAPTQRRVIFAAVVSYLLLAAAILGLQAVSAGPDWYMKFFWTILIQNVPLYLAQLLFLIGYLLLYSQLARSHEDLRLAASRIEELTRLMERQRLARDLHDTLAQGLAGVVMQLEVANSHLVRGRTPRGQELVGDALLSARETLVGARQAIDDLRSETTVPIGLAAWVQEEIRRFRSTTEVVCHTDVAALETLPPSLHEPVVHVIGEGLHNIALHAGAREVAILAGREGQMFVLDVHDDGCGFDQALVGRRGHYGLVGLRERAHLAGGQLDIASAPGQGTTLRLSLPIEGA